MTAYFVYDVFTDAPFGGNQLAIFPDATTLAEDSLQTIAREFNFSETTFVYPPQNPENTAKVRIFTPTMEIPFAGHPTVGTAVALHALGRPADMVLELGVGPLRCFVDGNTAAFTTERPLETIAYPDPAIVAAAVSLDPNAIIGQPVQASLGLPFVLVELRDRAALADAMPNTDGFRQGAAAYPAGMDFAIYCYVRDQNTVHARMFAPLDNIPEDPATGSAAATLTAFLAGETAISLTIHQGVEMGRPSVIQTSARDGQVTVSGAAVKTMEGRLTV